MNNWQRICKRSFDIFLAFIGLIFLVWIIMIFWLISTVETGQNGFFTQQRVGRYGVKFPIIKIRTMWKNIDDITSVVTKRGDPRVTRFGSFLRRYKLDELPQLFNVLIGQMSFVGPRPDVAGFADRLKGEDRIILSLRPGITGPATLMFCNEEDILAGRDDPERYNRDVLFMTKVKINRQYIQEYRFYKDVLYIVATIVPWLRKWIISEVDK